MIGFESSTRRALEGVEQRKNWKAKQFGFCRSAVEKIQRHGITVNGCFVIGLDGAGPEQFSDVLRFAGDSGLFDVQITFLTPFPGTPLYSRLQQSGRILQEGAWERCTLFDINFQPDRLSVSELENGFRQLGMQLYSDAFVKERHRRFFDGLRAARREQRIAA